MMKNIILILLILPLFVNGQNSNWQNNPLNERAFVKNMGQYDRKNWQPENNIEFALNQQDGWFTFFTKKGITHRLEKLTKIKGGDNSPHRVHTSELIDVFFMNANPNVKIIAENKMSHYYSYAVRNQKTNEITNIKDIAGYEKITYKNIYNNIDIEYTLHPDGGIKYNVILHPGADPSQIKMQYKTKHSNFKNENISFQLNQIGQLEINTSTTNLIEHEPHTFYALTKSAIKSKYVFNNDVLSFDLENYDNSKTVIIDPWIITPNFNASAGGAFVREVETDGAGNIYALGGEGPMELRKYNSAGALQWTYVTPWDTVTGDWLGTLATDDIGTSYITQGTSPEIERIDNTGAMIWHANGTGALTEYWAITFNCDNTKLIVGGTGSSTSGTFPNIQIHYEATIYDIDINNGNELSSIVVDTSSFASSFSNPTPIEVRSIASTKNSKYAFLTHKNVGMVSQNLTACSSTPFFKVDNTEQLAYKCENYLPSSQNGGGLKALIANDNYIYTHKGDEILQWDVNTGALLNTVALPGGSASHGVVFGQPNFVVHCNGLDVDASGNVYAGSMDRVVKFDANLNILSTAMTTGGFTVYDVSVNSNGEVLACGAMIDNSVTSGRGGRIESLSLSAGSQYATVCCDPNFCPVGLLCTTDAPVNLNPNTAGGTWSSSPVTAGLNTSTGVFDPSVAGAGTYTITYTLACGSNSTVVNVGTCVALTICLETNGDLTVSGGVGSYAWDEWTPATSTPITNQTECTSCNGTWIPGFPPWVPPSCTDMSTGSTITSCNTPPGWASFGTGITITPPVGVDSIKVVDGFGDSIIVTISTLAPCSITCDATITQAGPFCANASVPSNLVAAQTGGTWSGTGIIDTLNGTFDPAAAGVGSWVITYTLSCGDVDTMTIVINALDSVGFSYAQGSYCLTDPNPVPTNTGLSGGTYTINNGGTINPTTGEINIAVSGAGNYIITYTTSGLCPNSGTFNIVLTSGANATITQVPPVCSNNNNFIALTAVDAGGVWSGIGVTGASFDPVTAGVGSHVITYTISGSCGDVDTMTIVVNASDTAAFNYLSGSYCLSDPDPSPTITGTIGGTFTIDNGGSINSTTGLINLVTSGNGTYIVTYATSGSCPDTATFNITITTTTDATITQVGPFCANEPSLNLSAVSSGGTWTGTGITNATNGTFDPTTAGVGNHIITYTITGSCGDVDTMTIVVNSADVASFNYSSNNYCLGDPNPIATITGTTGGIFTINNGGSINSTTGEVTLASGNFVVTYTTSGVCPDSTTFSISVTSCTVPTAGYTVSDSTICEGDCVDFTDTSTGSTSWQWTFNGGSPSSSVDQNPTNICFNTAGTYTIEQIVTNTNGSDTATSSIVVNTIPVINAGNDVTIDLGQSTTLNATGTNGTYSWTPPTWLDCPLCVSPISTPDETITYTVIVVDSNGCTASDNVTVIVDFDNVIFVPNIFSPNGDGNNDVLYVRGLGVESFNFFIYDRWGEKVFETQDLDKGWDGTFRGKKMNNAVFVYYLQATFIDGNEVKQKGDITLIR